jgi:hypothetical protein
MTDIARRIIKIDAPLSVDHVMTPAGWFGLDIAAVIPGEPNEVPCLYRRRRGIRHRS